MAIAYFSTWTTYGTWLPGDARGWFQRGTGVRGPDLWRKSLASLFMSEDALTLDAEQRLLVESVIRKHCEIRKWELHAVSCRSNHVHVVVSAMDRAIEIPREQFKSWSTRRLKELELKRDSLRTPRLHWWADRGWDVYIDTDQDLGEVVEYVAEGQ